MASAQATRRSRKVSDRRDRRPWHPTPRAPLPAKLTDDEIVGLVNERARAGKRRNAQVERNVVILWRTLERLAHVDCSGHVATSRPQLIKALCGSHGIPKWKDFGDPERNELHHGRALQNWLTLLLDAGLLESAGGVRHEADGSWWRTEIIMRPMTELSAERSAN